MSVDCAGRHQCEPPEYPQSADARWMCPDCRRRYVASDVHADNHIPERYKRHIPAGTLGWRSPPPA